MKKLLIFFGLLIVVFGIVFFVVKFNDKQGKTVDGRLLQNCINKETGVKLTYGEALEIAKKSDCSQLSGVSVAFTENYLCNENSGTFWVDLKMDPEKVGCSPACVVNVSDKTAEINWRCTGLINPK